MWDGTLRNIDWRRAKSLQRAARSLRCAATISKMTILPTVANSEGRNPILRQRGSKISGERAVNRDRSEHDQPALAAVGDMNGPPGLGVPTGLTLKRHPFLPVRAEAVLPHGIGICNRRRGIRPWRRIGLRGSGRMPELADPLGRLTT